MAKANIPGQDEGINSEPDPDERSILVESIPYETDDVRQLKDHLKEYFQEPSSEGGQVDKIICPVGGAMTTAIVVFIDPDDAVSTVQHRNHQFGGDDLDVSLLPPIFGDLTLTIDKFYWNMIPGKESKTIADKIEGTLGKANIEERKTNMINKVRCTWQQLPELQSMLLATGPLGCEQDVLERSVYITDVPYLTDDRQQLEKELETYFQRVAADRLQRLTCGIQGDLTKAVAVFHTIEDAVSFLDFTETKKDEANFLEEELSASRLPPLFLDVTARCDDFYLKMLPKKSREKLQSAIEETGGSGMTCTKNIKITGSFRQINAGKEVIMEAVGIASTKEKQKQVARERGNTGKTESSTNDVEPVTSEVNTSTNGNGTKANDVPRRPNEHDERSKTQTTESSASDVELGKSDLDTSTAPTNGNDAAARDVPRRYQERSNTGTSESSSSKESGKANSGTSKSALPIAHTATKRDDDTARDGPRHTQGRGDTRTSQTSGSCMESEKPNSDAVMNTLSMSTRRDGATASDAPDNKRLTHTSDGKYIIVKHPGKAQLQRQSGQHGLRDGKWDSQNSKRSVDEDKQKGDPGSTSKEKIRISVDDEQHTDEQLPEGTKEKCSKEERADGVSGLGNQKESKPGKEIDQEGTGEGSGGLGARKDSWMGRDTKASTIQNQSTTNDQSGTRSTADELLSSTLPESQDDVGQCAEVDEVIFEYITTRCKDEYDAIQTKYGVSITANKPKVSSSSRKLVVEVKKLGKTRTQTSNKTLDAQHDFIRLYSKTIADVVCKNLDCGGIKAEKITKAKAMMTKKFKDVLAHKVSNKEFIFCGKESIVADGMSEFQITAGMIGEENEYLSVDKIAFQYLKSMTSEVESIEKKYNVYFDLKELKEASSDQQQAVYIKPKKSGNQKTKLKGNVTTQAKEEFISVYQSHFFALKRIQLSCQDVPKGKIQEAVNVTRSKYPTVMISKKEGSDYMLYGKDDVVPNAVKEFRRIAGLLPAGRKLRRTTSSEGNQEHIPSSIQSNAAAASERITSGSPSTLGQVEDLPYTFATKEGIQIIVLEGDITKQEVNIVVNAANAQLRHRGGVAKAIAMAAGPKLQKECDDLMRMRRPLQIGECVATSGYQLHCDHVIHTVGPFFDPKLETDVSTFVGQLKKTFLNVLMYADGITSVKTIAIPLISSGNYGGPKEACTEALALALRDFSTLMNRKELQQVFLVNIDANSTKALQQTLCAYFPSTSAPPRSTPSSKGASCNQYPHIVRTLTTKEGLTITITMGDITTLKVDAIVNAANEHLRHDRGVAAAIATAAGSQLTDESEQIMARRKHQPLQVGEIKETGAYKLPCKTVIHAVGPRYDTCPSKDVFHSMLKQTFSAVLKHANGRVESASLALPLISSGVFGGPKELCSNALVEAVKEFSESTTTLIIKSLHLINSDQEATRAIDGAFHASFHTSQGPKTTSRPANLDSKGGAHFVTSEGISIYVEQGDITKQRVDAIVNPTDTKLSNAGGVSQAILKAAGDKFRNECRDLIKHRVNLNPCEVVHTSGGYLPSRYIFSVDSPFFKHFRSESEYSSVLQDTVKACLRKANHSLKLASIALPVMGTGTSGAPPHLSILAMANGIREMSRTATTLVLNQIKVICVDKKTVDGVKSTFDNIFSGSISGVGTEHVTIQTIGVSNQGASNVTKRTNPIHTTSANNTQSSTIYQTTEGIRVEVDGRDFSTLKVDVLFVAMDTGMRHNDEVRRKLEDAGGPGLLKEVKGVIKDRKQLKPGERIGTKGHWLPCNDIVHYVESIGRDAESIYMTLLLHGKTTLGAKSIAFVVDSISKSSTENLVKAIIRFSQRLSKVNLLIHVVGINLESVSAATDAFSRNLRQIGQATVRTSPSLTVATFAKSTLNQGHTQEEHGTLPKSSPSSSHFQSHRKAPTAPQPDEHTPTLKCRKCYTTTNVGKLESCGHAYCHNCIKKYMASTLTCPECHEFYCLAEEKSLHGTMTAYRRSDIHLAGSNIPGVIFIRYEFPVGTQGPHHPSPGKPYNGTTALAYLPCDSEGYAVARRLREAFVAGLTFTVKRKKYGGYEVGWSDEIPHKRNTKGGIHNNGFPDPDYMKRVNSALDKKLQSHQSANVNKGSGYRGGYGGYV